MSPAEYMRRTAYAGRGYRTSLVSREWDMPQQTARMVLRALVDEGSLVETKRGQFTVQANGPLMQGRGLCHEKGS